MDPTLCQEALAVLYYEWMLQSNKIIMFSVLIFLILEAKYPGIYLRAQWSTKRVCPAITEQTLYLSLRNLPPALSVIPILQTCPLPQEKDLLN